MSHVCCFLALEPEQPQQVLCGKIEVVVVKFVFDTRAQRRDERSGKDPFGHLDILDMKSPDLDAPCRVAQTALADSFEQSLRGESGAQDLSLIHI